MTPEVSTPRRAAAMSLHVATCRYHMMNFGTLSRGNCANTVGGEQHERHGQLVLHLRRDAGDARPARDGLRLRVAVLDEAVRNGGEREQLILGWNSLRMLLQMLFARCARTLDVFYMDTVHIRSILLVYLFLDTNQVV